MNTNRLALLMGAVLLVAGCDRKEGVRAYDAPKEPPPPAPVAAASSPGEPHWTAPPSWKPAPPGAMNVAAYMVSENPPLRMTVSQVTMTGSGAATVLANVNRWEGQVGLPPTPQADISKVVTPVQLTGREGLAVDLTGPNPGPDGKPQQRMLAALIPDENKVWTLKLMGPADQVAPHKAEFDAVVKSVHFDTEAHGATASTNDPATPAPAAPPAAGAQTATKIPGIAAYTLPEGWQVDPRPRQMREATLIVTSGGEQAEVIVTRLNPNSLSDISANINRWRGQVHLPPGDAAAHPEEPVTLAQGPAVIRGFAGPESDGPARKRQLVAMTQFPNQGQIWFFRFVGPHDLIAKQKPSFEAFVKSLKFEQ